VDRLLSRVLPQVNEHLTDDRIGGVLCLELAWLDNFIAKRHLAACPLCRVRLENIEARADRIIPQFQRQLERRDKPVPPDDTEEFLMRLDRDFAGYVPRKRHSFRWPVISMPEFSFMNPALATAMVLAIASALFIGVHAWNQQRTPRITSNALLVRAEKWDTASFATVPGVVYQAVKITTPQGTVQRRIYRDTQGKRRLKPVALDTQDGELQARMTIAGIDWDDPLSASGYQEWHDRQHIREDEITRVGRHLLTLTTSAPQGPVAEQSLTVRESDFHPVRRTIAFRDSRTVEIAEVDFKILPWSAVDANVFEPLAPSETAASAGPPRVIPFRLPTVVTGEQLDEAELGARLVLNQLHADTGERIEVARNDQDVQVKGVVDTDQRKTELQTQLSMVPHVSVAIRSIEDLKAQPDSEGKDVGQQIVSEAAQPSPLETYLLSHGLSVNALGPLSQQLVDNALKVDQESRAITNLLARFGPAEKTTDDLAGATLSELVFSHRERLFLALQNEQETLGKIEAVSDIKPSEVSSNKTVSLVDAAEKNLVLCQELTVGGNSPSRNVASIVAELIASANEVRARAHEMKLTSLHAADPGGKQKEP
jgi:hypothetical protein